MKQMNNYRLYRNENDEFERSKFCFATGRKWKILLEFVCVGWHALVPIINIYHMCRESLGSMVELKQYIWRLFKTLKIHVDHIQDPYTAH